MPGPLAPTGGRETAGCGRRELDLRTERAIDRLVGEPLIALLRLLVCGTDQGPPRPESVRRLLVIKLHGIGNLVMMQPSLRGLRRRFPGAEIELLTFRRNAGLVAGLSELSASHFIDDGNAWRIVSSSAALLASLRRRRYDLVVDFEQFANLSAILAGLSGGRHRVGFRNPARRRHVLFTTSVSYIDAAHMTRAFFRLARAAGVPPDDYLSRPLSIRPDEFEEAVAFEASEGIGPADVMAILHPGSSPNLTLRRWPEERFAALGERLAGGHGARIVVSGGADELDLARRVAQSIGPSASVAAGRLSILGMAALCERAEFVVSNDTSLVHLASAMGTPVAAIYGPNTPFLYGPTGDSDLVFYRDLPCSPCLVNTSAKLSNCRRARCVEAVSVDEVVEGIEGAYFGPDGRLWPRFKKDRSAGKGRRP